MRSVSLQASGRHRVAPRHPVASDSTGVVLLAGACHAEAHLLQLGLSLERLHGLGDASMEFGDDLGWHLAGFVHG
ncbi:hypothetical protein DBR12_16870 [Acidovorax sp. HMWF029]|nr:hypothetical protein DBR12_16870 [Acidovorax sp. HMWF029]